MSAEDEKTAGNEAYKYGRLDDAIHHYSNAIGMDPENATYYSNRSACYGGKRQWELALSDAKTCIAKDRTFIRGYERLAKAQIALKLFDDARLTIRDGQNIDEENDSLQGLLASIKGFESISRFASYSDPSWCTHLICDPNEEEFRPNHKSRQVFSGHYVPVQPIELSNPHLIIYSDQVVEMVGLSNEACTTQEFLHFFSGYEYSISFLEILKLRKNKAVVVT